MRVKLTNCKTKIFSIILLVGFMVIPSILSVISHGTNYNLNSSTKLSNERTLPKSAIMSNFNDHLEEDVHYSTSFEEIRIYVAGAYPVFKKWARAHYFDGDLLPESIFKKQLKKEIYFIENKVVRFGDKTRNTFILDLHKMMEKGLEISEEWKIEADLEG